MKNQSLRPIFILIVLSLVFVIVGGCTPAKKTYTVGVLNLATALEPVFDGFKEEMSALGYVEGENITYIYNGPAGSLDNLLPLGQELVDADVDLVLALSTPASLTMKNLTTEIPIVFAPIFDPVKAGLVQSVSNPGGNLTGVQFGVVMEAQLGWLLKLAPETQRVFLPYNPEDPAASLAVERVQDEASKIGLEIVLREAPTEDEIFAAIEEVSTADVDAVFLVADSLVVSHMGEFAAAAVEKKIPMSVPTGELVEGGPLFSFSSRFKNSGQVSAKLADQILNGTPPAELPVETDEFFLVINLKTANEIGLTIPNEYILQADEVIR